MLDMVAPAAHVSVSTEFSLAVPHIVCAIARRRAKPHSNKKVIRGDQRCLLSIAAAKRRWRERWQLVEAE
jgi:hypothetical protein